MKSVKFPYGVTGNTLYNYKYTSVSLHLAFLLFRGGDEDDDDPSSALPVQCFLSGGVENLGASTWQNSKFPTDGDTFSRRDIRPFAITFTAMVVQRWRIRGRRRRGKRCR